MGPVELLKLTSSKEKLLSHVHILALDKVRVQLNQRNTSFQDKLRMSIKINYEVKERYIREII